MRLANCCVGATTDTTPPQAQAQVDTVVTHGRPLTVTLREPGVHGVEVAGTQGCGVSVPWAAVVAAATCGLARLTHIPNDAMLVVGLKSVTTANVVVAVAGPGSAVSAAGVVPIVQAMTVPVVTACVISAPMSIRFCTFLAPR